MWVSGVGEETKKLLNSSQSLFSRYVDGVLPSKAAYTHISACKGFAVFVYLQEAAKH